MQVISAYPLNMTNWNPLLVHNYTAIVTVCMDGMGLLSTLPTIPTQSCNSTRHTTTKWPSNWDPNGKWHEYPECIPCYEEKHQKCRPLYVASLYLYVDDLTICSGHQPSRCIQWFIPIPLGPERHDHSPQPFAKIGPWPHFGDLFSTNPTKTTQKPQPQDSFHQSEGWTSKWSNWEKHQLFNIRKTQDPMVTEDVNIVKYNQFCSQRPPFFS